VSRFGRSSQKFVVAPAGAAGAPSAPAGVGQVATATEHFSGLSVSQRAAEILQQVTTSLDERPLPMDQILATWLPQIDWMTASDEQAVSWQALAQILQEAFQGLVLARMVIRQEQDYKGATYVTYANSPDGRGALQRGDVGDVIARRLPE
jgi:hypothetical protein